MTPSFLRHIFQMYILLLIFKLGPQHLLLERCAVDNTAITKVQNTCMDSAGW